MKKSFRHLLAGAVAAAALSLAAIPVFAATTATDTGTGSVTGNVAINGSISPLTISVTHPINAAYAISPDAGTFTAPDIAVTNNTKAAVSVTVQSLTAASGGSLTFTDVDPSAKSWSTLSNADSKKYIALGIHAKDSTGWNTGYSTATHWASDKTALPVGSLGPNTTGSLSLTADYGLAFDAAYTANHSLVFLFQLV
ncbi:MAG: hypothetical protein ABF904_11310 [Ethanoligenens sp.]